MGKQKNDIRVSLFEDIFGIGLAIEKDTKTLNNIGPSKKEEIEAVEAKYNNLEAECKRSLTDLNQRRNNLIELAIRNSEFEIYALGAVLADIISVFEGKGYSHCSYYSDEFKQMNIIVADEVVNQMPCSAEELEEFQENGDVLVLGRYGASGFQFFSFDDQEKDLVIDPSFRYYFSDLTDFFKELVCFRVINDGRDLTAEELTAAKEDFLFKHLADIEASYGNMARKESIELKTFIEEEERKNAEAADYRAKQLRRVREFKKPEVSE